MERIVVVGGSLAGLRGAEALRAGGFDGSLTIVGDEPHLPYDRPPLSKEVLAGAKDAAETVLRGGETLDATWRREQQAVALDLDTREVEVQGGGRVGFDGLLIACGASPRRLPDTSRYENVVALRTLDDVAVLRRILDAGASRIAVVGAGFIGCEVAATCRERGVDVTVVEPLEAPLARVLGPAIGGVIAEVHREHGVDLRLSTAVEHVEGEGDAASGLRLSDGSTLAADAVVVGIGVVPNVGWLEGSGLTLDDGVVCDETTLAAPGVVAAGDVARWPNPTYGGELMRVEHWEHAINMGVHAAHRLLAGDGPGEPFATVPWFWSDQYDRKVQLAGRVRPTDDLAVVAGSFEDRRFCALYGREGRVTGVLAMNMPAKVIRYRKALADGLGWDEALADAAAPPG